MVGGGDGVHVNGRWMWRAGNSIVKNLVEETSSIWAPNRGGFDKIFDKIWATRFLGSFRSH